MKMVRLDESERAGRLFGYYIRTKVNAGCQPRDCPYWHPIANGEVYALIECDFNAVARLKKPSVGLVRIPPLNGNEVAVKVRELERYLFDEHVDMAIVYHADKAVLLSAPLAVLPFCCANGDRYMRLDSFETHYAIENAKREGCECCECGGGSCN